MFEAYPNAQCFGEIYTVDSDGQHLTNITDNRCQSGSSDPVWSPDGKKILFRSTHAEGDVFGTGLAPSHPLVDDLYRAHYSSVSLYDLPQLLSAPAYPTVGNSPVDRVPQHFSRELALRDGFQSYSQFENPSSPEGLIIHRSRADERRLAGAQSLRGRSCSAVVDYCRHLGKEPVMGCRVDHTHVVRHV